MIDTLLIRANASAKTKVAVKTIVSAALIVIALTLPQVVHIALGASGGIMLLPMYFPILIGGMLLGSWWGLAVAVISPIFSYLFTSAFTVAMPALERLPFMVIELSVFAVVSGLFSKHIEKRKWLAFPAVITAMVSGRAIFVALVAIFDSLTPLSVGMVWSQVKIGLIGMAIFAVVVPLITIAISKLINQEK